MTANPIVIGLTTVRTRLPGVVEVLRTLLSQTRPADEIRLHLSHEPFAYDAGVSEADIPDEVRRWREAGRVRVVWTPNFGPYRKILPMLRDFRGADARLVTADDDVLYPPNWLAALTDTAERHPRAVVAHRVREARARGGRLARYQSWPVAGRLSPEVSPLFIPTGVGGVLYRPAFFDDRVLAVDVCRRLCPLSDDVWLRAATLAAGIPVARASIAAPTLRSVPAGGPRLWDAAIASDSTDIALLRALSHFGLSPSAFAPGPAERRRLLLPLVRTAGDPRAGGRRPVRTAVAWAAALASRGREPDPVAAADAVAFTVAPGSASETGVCVASVRRFYPDAPVWVETPPPMGGGGRHIAEVFRRFLAAPRADVLVRLLPASRMWRRFRSFPADGFFGVPGARGFRRSLIQTVMASGIAEDPAYADVTRWPADPETRERAETRERFLNEPDLVLILADMMRRAGASAAPWREVRAGDVWPRGNFLNAWAVTRMTG